MDEAWRQFEQRVASAKPNELSQGDIPWPCDSGWVANIAFNDSKAIVKRKMTDAVRRWHIDKWRWILDKIRKEDQADVIARVNAMAQRAIEEREHPPTLQPSSSSSSEDVDPSPPPPPPPMGGATPSVMPVMVQQIESDDELPATLAPRKPPLGKRP